MDKITEFFRRIFAIPGERWPTWQQWKRLPKVLPSQERWLTRGLILAILICLITLGVNLYHNQTNVLPELGGKYQEGILGQPRFINPILAQTNDADRDVTQLVYSSLFKYNGQGELILDLADNYTISEDGLTYDIYLKQNVLWHDNEPLTANDVIFTIKTIQDPEYRSPLKNNWQGVQIEKIDEFSLRFKLNNVYAPFIHNLTVGILPKHLWAGISASNFPLAQYNLKPIGSGPYQFKEFHKDENGKIDSIELERNQNFYLAPGPFIDKITLLFYDNQADLITAYQKGQIDGLNFISPSDQSKLNSNLNTYQINLPIYYAVFFNQTKSVALADKTVRLALAHATNKQEIIAKALNNQAEPVDSPLLSGWLGYTSETKVYDLALEHAQNIMEAAGWKDTDGDGIRQKQVNNQEALLEITLLATDWPELKQTAEILKEQWEKIGLRVNLEIVSTTEIQQEYIRPREYQALLFGEVLNADPDPFAFWHSSQKKDPGLNLSLYQNKDVDKLLEDARQTMNQEERAEKYIEFQKLLTDDLPAIFLYSPDYLYPVSKKIKGIAIEKIAQPSQRFSQIETWYLKTKREWKNR